MTTVDKTIIKIARGNAVEENRRVAIRRLNDYNHIVGQPVMVRYYTDPSKTSINTVVAMGVKDGKGIDCYQLISVFNKDIIYGISDNYRDFPITKFPTKTERFIFVDPEKDNKPFYVTVGKTDVNGPEGRCYEEITDGPRIYEDVSTGHTIYFTESGSIQVGNGYTNEDIDRMVNSRMEKNFGSENSGKFLKVVETGEVEPFNITDDLFTAGENIEIENNTISAPNVICQYSEMPEAKDNIGKVCQYIGETTDKLIQNRFYKADSKGWNLISIQSNFTNILVLTKKEYDEIVEKDVDTLYFIKEGFDEADLSNSVFIYDMWAKVLPEASLDFVNECYIYVGETNSNFRKGHIYECRRKFDNVNEYEWFDITEGPAISLTYQTLTAEENYLSSSDRGFVKYVSSLDDVESIYKNISTMKGFNGVIRTNEGLFPIVRINGRKELGDTEDKNNIYIDFTFISPTTFTPTTRSISANKTTVDTGLKFYLTIIS